MNKVYRDLYDLAVKENFEQVKLVLDFLRDELDSINVPQESKEEYLIHGTMVAVILSDIKLEVSASELDVVMAAAVCHILLEMEPAYSLEDRLKAAGLKEAVAVFARRMVNADIDDSELGRDATLFMVKLVERTNLIEHLSDMSDEEAKVFIHHTKRILLPLCIDAKDIYPQYQVQIGLFIEKMRTLIQVMDILYTRFDAEEEELYSDILSLKDENHWLRSLMK